MNARELARRRAALMDESARLRRVLAEDAIVLRERMRATTLVIDLVGRPLLSRIRGALAAARSSPRPLLRLVALVVRWWPLGRRVLR
jgi:hypothetical protein